MFFFALLSSTAIASTPDISKYFQGSDVCVIVKSSQKQGPLIRQNDKRCSERLPPCSTFKVPLALIAIEEGIIKDENTPFKWDGKTRDLPQWNKDHTAASWMKDSVVWVSQQLTKTIGKDKLEKYLKTFGYGTADMSGGLETAWLAGAKNATVLISADEQSAFLERLYDGTLPVSKKSMDLVKKLIALEARSDGLQISGKTGSGLTESTRLGWFIAHLQKGNQRFTSVVNFSEPKTAGENRFGGMDAKERTKKILTELGI